MDAYFIGIDIGTQGARVVLTDRRGEIVATEQQVFGLSETSREEQSPEEWWGACQDCLVRMMQSAAAKEKAPGVKAIAVSSTSGTVIPIDKQNHPLHNALMYSDKRAVAQGEKCTAAAITYHGKGFTAFGTSSGLAKMVWFVETYPEQARQINKWIHAADYITGMLCNVWDVTDHTNAFKSGYDVANYNWPEYIYAQLPIKKRWLQEVVPSGTVIGTINPRLAQQLGLRVGVQVTAGITDGCASQIAAGAINPGEWNTTIGTTMVIKGVTEKEVLDNDGRVYSHRHPAGYWMPGGASNTGADWVTNEYAHDLENLNAQAAQLLPTNYMAYPLRQQGERFPFIAPQAKGFEPETATEAERYTANMEGVAYIERYAYELIEHLSGEQVKAVYTAGGASNSTAWLKIRAAVLNRTIYKTKHASGAVGAAVLAASKTYFSSIIEAVKHMVNIKLTVAPDAELVEKYQHNYQRFLQLLQEKGYIKEGF